MKNLLLATFSKIVLITPLILFGLQSNVLLAQTSQEVQTISHQGVLVNETGDAVDDGAYIFTFRIYDTDTDGNHLWRETQVLQVQNGVFNAQLGSEDQLDIPFDQPYWLGIEIDGGEELAPRMPLSAAPYALHAYSVAERSVSGASLTDDALMGGDNVSVERNDDGDFIISAATPDGGLISVSVDSTMIGDGTSEQPLGISLPDGYLTGNLIANQTITGLKIDENTLLEGDNITIERDQDGNFVLTAETPDGGLTSVSVDATLTGDGTSEQPLAISLPDGYLTGNLIAEQTITGFNIDDDALAAGDNVTIERNQDGNFVVTSAAPDDVLTSVSVDATLTGDGTSEQPLGISLPDNYISGNQLTEDISIETSGSIQTQSTITAAEGISADRFFVNPEGNGTFSYIVFRGDTHVQTPRIFHSENTGNLSVAGFNGLNLSGDLEVTGTKNFIHPHPHDPSKQIRYTALEAGESGVYWRGSAVTENGRAEIDLPEHFTLVTHEENLTANITPKGGWAPLYVEEVSTTRLVVVLDDRFDDPDTEFDFMIHGVRDGFEDYEVIEERTAESMD